MFTAEDAEGRRRPTPIPLRPLRPLTGMTALAGVDVLYDGDLTWNLGTGIKSLALFPQRKESYVRLLRCRGALLRARRTDVHPDRHPRRGSRSCRLWRRAGALRRRLQRRRHGHGRRAGERREHRARQCGGRPVLGLRLQRRRGRDVDCLVRAVGDALDGCPVERADARPSRVRSPAAPARRSSPRRSSTSPRSATRRRSTSSPARRPPTPTSGRLTADGIWTVDAGAHGRLQDAHPRLSADRRQRSSTARWSSSGSTSAAASTPAPDWIMAHTELIRDGFAWVGVSAQFVGVEGGGSIVGPAGHAA